MVQILVICEMCSITNWSLQLLLHFLTTGEQFYWLMLFSSNGCNLTTFGKAKMCSLFSRSKFFCCLFTIFKVNLGVLNIFWVYQLGIKNAYFQSYSHLIGFVWYCITNQHLDHYWSFFIKLKSFLINQNVSWSFLITSNKLAILAGFSC